MPDRNPTLSVFFLFSRQIFRRTHSTRASCTQCHVVCLFVYIGCTSPHSSIVVVVVVSLSFPGHDEPGSGVTVRTGNKRPHQCRRRRRLGRAAALAARPPWPRGRRRLSSSLPPFPLLMSSFRSSGHRIQSCGSGRRRLVSAAPTSLRAAQCTTTC